MRIRYSNALLWRGRDDSPSLETFDVVDGLIAFADELIQSDQEFDLQSAFVMPAFRDGHCHPLFAGREHVGPDVTEARDLETIAAIIRRYVSEHPTTFWIDGAAYDRSIAAQFHRSELDEILDDKPLVLHGADHHTLWVNTKALQLAGLLESIPKVSAGSVDLDENGVPTGILREWEAMQLVMKHIPALTMDQELDAIDWAQNRLLNDGVVEVQDAWIDIGMTEVYLEAARRGHLKVKTNLAFRADPATWAEDYEYFEDMRKQVHALAHPHLNVNAIKFFVDGVLGSSTASVLEPYIGGPAKDSHGEQVWRLDALIEAASEANRLGYQLHLHAIGDAAVRTALDLIEIVRPAISAVIAHTELVSDSDIPRFKTLGVVANFEPLWAREDGQLLTCVAQLGRDRLDGMYRMRDLVDAGASISFGSDWPVSSPAPLLGIATAVNRSLPGGPSWSIELGLSIREALLAYTSGSALQISGGTRNGQLEAGSDAEFVVLSSNPFNVPREDLFSLEVLGTSTKSQPLLTL